MNDRKAGVLVERHTGSGYISRYDENYLASDGPAISVTMPKLRVPLESEILFPVSANMLPEGSNRKIICRSLRIDENDYFGLLALWPERTLLVLSMLNLLPYDEYSQLPFKSCRRI